MPAEDHLQLSEVLDYLKANQDCAIVDPDTGWDVVIEFDRAANWRVNTMLKVAPESTAKRKLKAAGLKTNIRKMLMHFGPHRGETIGFFTVDGEFDSADAAARAALSVFATVWQVPTTRWLWVTAIQHDDREEPKRPSVWPPAGT